jgi:predicted TIM-barrel fold metal-dependent hydrolase
MSSYRVISSDNHVIEPYDLWTSRAESKYAWRVPHVEDLGEKGDYWVCDGQKVIGVTGGSASVGNRFLDPDKKRQIYRVGDVRPGGWIPEEHVKDLDIDGQDASILYPTVGFMLFGIPDGQLLDSLCRSYNDWVGEFCGAIPKRLKGIAMINTDDVQVGIKELERCAKIGHIGAMIAVYPGVEQLYDNPAYEPFWAAAQDLEMPLSLHIASNRYSPVQELGDRGDNARPAFHVNTAYWPQMSLADIILSGVFERFPKLQVGSVEHELSWAPHFLDRLDYTYTDRMPPPLHPSQGPPEAHPQARFKDGALPSDFFRSNCFLGFQEDAMGIRDRHIIGVDNLQWGADYPHSESTFPRSREILENILADCSEEEKAKISGGNAAKIYHLD